MKWVVFVGVLVGMDSCTRPPICGDAGGNLDPFESFIHSICAVLPTVEVGESTMLAIVGSTTVAVLGLVLAVVKGLFPSR